MTSQRPAPPALEQLQRWFAAIIERPIDIDSSINPVAPSGRPISEEACDYIRPSPTLPSHRRIEVYNQQYWWRLLSVLHESFPMLTRLFGYRAFNQKIGFPYICQCRPDHWSLSYLGCRLPLWVQQHYQGPDHNLVLYAAQMDQAYNDSFIAPHATPLTLQQLQQSQEAIFAKTVHLQPHIQLFSMRHHLFALRDGLLEHEPEFWEEQGLPTVAKQKKMAFMVWRDSLNNVGWLQLPNAEALLLQRFAKGCSFNRLFKWIEGQRTALYEECAANLQQWTQRWVLNEWIYLPPGPPGWSSDS